MDQELLSEEVNQDLPLQPLNQEEGPTSLRFTSLEEVPRRPFPIRPIPAAWWTPEKARDVWGRMASYNWMLSDTAKEEFEFVFRETMAGRIHWFELGRGLGIAHVYGIENGVGCVNVEFFGNKREFFRVFGSGKSIRDSWIKSVMMLLKLRKLRAFIVNENQRSRRLALRMGFEEEGLLKKEWIIRGRPVDVWVYGLLGEENG
jgi:hypothetical protein